MLVPSLGIAQTCTNEAEYTVENETSCDLYVTVSYGDLANPPSCAITVSFVVDANDDHTETTDVSWDYYVDAVLIELWNSSTSTAYGNPYGAQYQCSSAETDDLDYCTGSNLYCVHFNSDCTAARVEPSRCP